jgi:hypothetical protein
MVPRQAVHYCDHIFTSGFIDARNDDQGYERKNGVDDAGEAGAGC